MSVLWVLGRIEYTSEQGAALTTNYQRICPSLLHRSNGGYLILDADKLLNSSFVWEGFKRALKSGYIEIESPYAELGINKDMRVLFFLHYFHALHGKK